MRVLIAALPEAGEALELLAVADAFDDGLASDLLERFADTNGTTSQVLAQLKSLPFVLRVDATQWSFQDPARDALLDSLRSRQTAVFEEVSRFLVATYAMRAEQQTGRSSRDALWRAALQALPIDPEYAVDQLEALVEQGSGYNRGVDVDATASLAEANTSLLHGQRGEVAYFVGRRAYSRRERVVAEQQFRLALKLSDRPSMRAIAGHLLANLLLEQGRDLAEAQGFARASLELHRQVRAPHEVAFVEVTLARILLREVDQDAPIEARTLLDDAIQRLDSAHDDAGKALALMARTRYYLQAQALDSAKDDSALAVELARGRGDIRRLSNALTTRANVLIRDGRRKQLAQAAQAIAEAERLARESEADDDLAAILNTRSLLAEAEGDMQKAIDYAVEALELNQHAGRMLNVEQTQERIRKLKRLRATGRPRKRRGGRRRL
jgi:tetratricopeptide (TPR) repeat protein